MGRNCCITIERQYGSGGREVARILSERLGIPCYGRELLAVTAADNGISIEGLKKLDEKRTGSLLHDLEMCIRDRSKGGFNPKREGYQ